jgi:hypothetical protein
MFSFSFDFPLIQTPIRPFLLPSAGGPGARLPFSVDCIHRGENTTVAIHRNVPRRGPPQSVPAISSPAIGQGHLPESQVSKKNLTQRQRGAGGNAEKGKENGAALSTQRAQRARSMRRDSFRLPVLGMSHRPTPAFAQTRGYGAAGPPPAAGCALLAGCTLAALRRTQMEIPVNNVVADKRGGQVQCPR